MLDFLSFFVHQNYVIFGFIVVTILVFLLRKNIHDHARSYYVGAVIVLLIVVGLFTYWNVTHSSPENSWYWPILSLFERGVVAYVLFTIVMFQGVIKPWNKSTKQLYAVRGELAVLGAIMSFTHQLTLALKYFLVWAPVGHTDWALNIMATLSLLGFIILVPLLITSAKKIRFSMGSKRWHKLHKISYIFYFLLYGAVIFTFVRRFIVKADKLAMNAPYRWGTYLSLIIYSAIFVVYTVLRIYTSIKKEKRRRIHYEAHEQAIKTTR